MNIEQYWFSIFDGGDSFIIGIRGELPFVSIEHGELQRVGDPRWSYIEEEWTDGTLDRIVSNTTGDRWSHYLDSIIFAWLNENINDLDTIAEAFYA